MIFKVSPELVSYKKVSFIAIMNASLHQRVYIHNKREKYIILIELSNIHLNTKVLHFPKLLNNFQM